MRWFTPATEVDLCGHATLAAGHVIFCFLASDRDHIVFRTQKAGDLVVSRQDELLALDFPSRPPARCAAPPGLAAALGYEPIAVLAARDYVAVYENPDRIIALTPDFAGLAKLDRAVIVTAPGRDGVDFVSRFFAPALGVDEDPVTGSAHCSLIPYWAEKLGRNRLQARQLSRRGGSLVCELHGDRVTIAGRTILYLTGTIEI